MESAGLEYPNTLRVIWFGSLAVMALAHWQQLGARWGRRLAVGALSFIVIYWGGLAFLHRGALARAEVSAAHLAAQHQENVMRVAAMPTLANPLHWRCLAETDRATYLYELTLGRQDDANLEDSVKRYEKPQNAEAGLAARAAQDSRAVVLLNFARFPVFRVEGDCLSQAIVQLADLRYTEPKGRGRSTGFAAVEIPVTCPPETVETYSR